MRGLFSAGLPVTTALRLAERPHPSSRSTSPLGRREREKSFPVLAARLCARAMLHATVRKPFVPPLKEGRRSADRRSHWFPPRPQKDKPASVCGARYIRPWPRIGAGLRSGALAFRRPTAVMRRGVYPSARFLPALPGITGSKREDPLRHQCSQHLAVRSRAGRSMPRTARKKVYPSTSGNRPRSA